VLRSVPMMGPKLSAQSERHRRDQLSAPSGTCVRPRRACRAGRPRVRPDDEIADDVSAVFTKILFTSPADVKVTVKAGVATLAGQLEHGDLIAVAVRRVLLFFEGEFSSRASSTWVSARSS